MYVCMYVCMHTVYICIHASLSLYTYIYIYIYVDYACGAFAAAEYACGDAAAGVIGELCARRGRCVDTRCLHHYIVHVVHSRCSPPRSRIYRCLRQKTLPRMPAVLLLLLIIIITIILTIHIVVNNNDNDNNNNNNMIVARGCGIV